MGRLLCLVILVSQSYPFVDRLPTMEDSSIRNPNVFLLDLEVLRGYNAQYNDKKCGEMHVGMVE